MDTKALVEVIREYNDDDGDHEVGIRAEAELAALKEEVEHWQKTAEFAETVAGNYLDDMEALKARLAEAEQAIAPFMRCAEDYRLSGGAVLPLSADEIDAARAFLHPEVK